MRLPGAAAKWIKISLSPDKGTKSVTRRLNVFWFVGSNVEYVTCVNTVSNITVLYDHWKHIRLLQIFSIILLLQFIIELRLFLYFHLVTYARYIKEVVRANCLY
jgi:hypothetical protein